ncbi:MAG: hypothetical protein SV760_08205 [Halobacteria archaeon]|nr:hypothetical protein [Halobacteria archaeon]
MQTGERKARRLLRRVSTGYIFTVLLGGVVFEALYFTGYLSRKREGFLFNSLYGFNLAVIAAAVVLLLWAYSTNRNKVLLLSSLSVLSWFLGSLFWVSYVFLLDKILLYPSVAQFAFHGFHLLMIPLLLYFVEKLGIALRKPSFVLVAVTASVPVMTYFVGTTNLAVAVYNIFYLSLVTSVLVLASHLVYESRLPLFGVALVAFSFADLNFITTTLSDEAPVVLSLDPIWFSAHALVSFSLVRYSCRGDLP